MEKTENPSLIDNFNIEIENFGPIAKANVEMRPLTVFIGPSNVGKSYLAMLIYSMYRCFGDHRRLSPFKTRGLHEFELRKAYLNELIDGPSRLNLLKEWLNTYHRGSVEPLPNGISSIIQRVIEQPSSMNFRNIKLEIERCFGVDSTDELIRRRSTRSKVMLDFSPNSNATSNSPRWEIVLSNSNRSPDNLPMTSKFKFNGPNKISEVFTGPEFSKYISYLFDRYWISSDTEFDNRDAARILTVIAKEAIKSSLNSIYKDAYYLPANRTGIMNAHQIVVSTLIQNATMAGIQPTASVPLLTGIIADYLDQLIHLPSYDKKSMQPFRHDSDIRARSIEEKIMRGEVILNQVNEFSSPDFSYRPVGWKKDLPFTRVSSMVSELAPIVLYLRYLVNPGDVLIIEEPEAHLHPAMQSKLAEELIMLVKIGVRIVVTTHSEWFLEKIGNLTRLSKIPEENLSEEEKKVSLDDKYLGVWLFHKQDHCDGSLVEEIRVDNETGLYPNNYSAVSVALYNDSAYIYNRLPQAYKDG